MNITISESALAAEFLQALAPDEAALVKELGDTKGNFTLTFSDGLKFLGYVVFSPEDATGYMAVFAGRAVGNCYRAVLAKSVLMGLFGAASICGKPMRLHSDRLAALAAMVGADFGAIMRDLDGEKIAVLSNGK